MEMNQYLSMFIDEANEHLQTLNESLLQLEQQPDDLGIVQVIFRSAHTLKGMSATMGFEDLASLTHEMENVLDLVRNGRLRMNEEIFDTLFKGLDALESMVRDVAEGGSGKADVTELVGRLKAIVSGGADASGAGRPASEGDAGAPAAASHQLDPYQLAVLRKSMDSGYRALRLEVILREDCLLKAARAYMVFNALEQNGEIVKSQPPVQDIEQEKFDRSFTVYYITKKEPSFIHDTITNISEIERVLLTELDQSTLQELEAQAGLAAQAGAGGAGSAPASAAQAAAAAETAGAPAPSAKPDAPRAEAAAPRAAKAGGSAAPRTIRVDIDRLDSLMNLFSELLISRARLEQLASEIRRNDLTETVEQMSRVSADLQNIVLKLRMVPVETVFNRFPRMVRDLAKSLNKKVDFIITGAETELDRTVVEEIGDPLVHLLRNALDHGLEPAAERVAAGKPETGKVHLRAFHSGNHVIIEIEDDGRGIQREKVLQKAIQNGLVTPEEAERMSDGDAYQLLFASGFSTAEKVSDISGRGVGLDVVKAKIEALGGRVTVHSTPGAGTRFTVQLPLTLSIISAMLVKLGPEKYAIPLSSIVETGVVKRQAIRRVHGAKVIDYRETIIPVFSLAELMESPYYRDDEEEESEMIVIRKGDRLAAILVDDFIGQSDIVLKSLGKYMTSLGVVFGATILGDGQVALIVDPNTLIA